MQNETQNYADDNNNDFKFIPSNIICLFLHVDARKRDIECSLRNNEMVTWVIYLHFSNHKL